MSQAVLDDGSVVRNSHDIAFVLNRLGVPGLLIDYIDEKMDEGARLERDAEARNNSDMRAYELSLEGYGVAMDDIKEILETFKGCARLNRDKVLDAFNEIKKLIDNVH